MDEKENSNEQEKLNNFKDIGLKRKTPLGKSNENDITDYKQL